jgi:hypothetical protein
MPQQIDVLVAAIPGPEVGATWYHCALEALTLNRRQGRGAKNGRGLRRKFPGS